MSNSDQLFNQLQAYQISLERHLGQAQDEFQQLEKQWRAFQHVYEGEAAEQFQMSWSRTLNWFRDHLVQIQVLSSILNERIEALNQLNQPGGH